MKECDPKAASPDTSLDVGCGRVVGVDALHDEGSTVEWVAVLIMRLYRTAGGPRAARRRPGCGPRVTAPDQSVLTRGSMMIGTAESRGEYESRYEGGHHGQHCR